MKKILTLLFCVCSMDVSAQVLDVNIGNVTYRYDAADCGNMTYGNGGTTLTIGNATYNLTEVDNITASISTSPMTKHTVEIEYAASSAKIIVAGDIADSLTINVKNGTDVSIVQDTLVSKEIKYTLSGSCSDGSFYHDGELKATFVLNGLTLTNPTGCAFRTDDGKRIAIDLEGTNSISDGTSSSDKGAMMINGHSEFTGSGTLNLAGYTKHALWADEYVLLKKTMTGTINITKSVKDGMNINQYFKQKGGTLNISGSIGDDGIQVGMEGSLEEDDGKIIISDGTLNITTTAVGAKALKADSVVNISGGTLTLTTTGNVDDSDASDLSKSSCIKSDIGIEISDGTFTLRNSGSAGKCINTDGYAKISGGNITINNTGTYYGSGTSLTKASGIHADGAITISDSASINITMTGAGAKGVKADTQLNITGGTVTATCSGATCGTGTYLSGCSAIKGETAVNISGGTVTGTSTGAGGKGINSDGTLTISGGTVTSTSSGSNYTSGSYHKYAKGMKADGNMVISGGYTTVSSANHEGMETKGTLNVTDGTLIVTAYDDAINSAGVMRISGGKIYSKATNNDGIDSNGNMYISGGTIIAIGSRAPECGLDVIENGTLNITGGTVIAFGGDNNAVSATTGSIPLITFSSTSQKFAVKNSTSTTTALVAYDGSTNSSTTSALDLSFAPGGGPGGNPGGGPGGGGTASSWLVASSLLTSGSKYYIYTEPTITASSSFMGLSTNSTASGGTILSTNGTTAATSSSSSQGGGGGWGW